MRYLTLFVLCVLGATDARAEAFAESRDYAVEGVIVPGNHTRIDTPGGAVHVWAPEGYVAETAILVVYVHGYFVELDDAWWAHGLPEQFGASGINALFVACEAPSGPWDSVRWDSMSDLILTIEDQIPEAMPKGRVVAIGHSGAYRTLLPWLRDPRLDTTILLDAGYGSRQPYVEWFRRAPHHRLITVSSSLTAWWSMVLARHLGAKTVVGFPERPEAVGSARAVHVRTDLDHWQVVTTALPAALQMLQASPLAP
jgi:hypothetical protein